MEIYSFLSGRCGSFHSNVTGATAGEAPYVLGGPATRTGVPAEELGPRERLRWRLDTPEGRARYARRMTMVAPICECGIPDHGMPALH